tara:strand:- start:2145 stop:2492 length:348 start_codon:yes stop_codon:yes gene_type:complete
MIKPNLIALLTDDEMLRDIPEALKEAAWQRGKDEDGKTTFTQRTWGEMTTDVHYLDWHGPTTVLVDAPFKGEILLGNTHVVKGRFNLMDDIDALAKEKLTIIQTNQLDKFLSGEL